MKFIYFLFIFLIGFTAFAQDQDSNYKTKIVVVQDTIAIDSVSINSAYFILKRKDNSSIDSTYYSVDFAKAIITLKKPIDSDSVIINYLSYPKFLTKTYKQLDDKIIVENTDNLQQLYKIQQSSEAKTFTPFDGLNTSGSISRGVIIGNNQNSVLNSELDLQITGKLSDKVSLRASIQDANIPLQESGYSQRLDEFDQVFVELFSDHWKIRAGDVDLENSQSHFANFSKRVQGLSLQATLNHSESKTNLFAAGAIVRGQFTSSQFTAQEGNQGPYKLRGPSGELFVLVVSGSETVYVNGITLERGENKDYIINYNAGEIIFNSTFPITSEMRITVDYQFSERNYSRLVVYGGGNYDSEKLKLGVSVYSENDAKNNPLQQNLSTEQVDILANAGDDQSLMTAPSATPETYNENRILYKKELISGVEAFVFSNDADDELFSVRFSLVGDNQGNYIISNVNAITTIYEYVEPIAGIPQGNYEPIVQLIAPNKLQIAVLNGSYLPTEKTNIDFEVAGSKNDLNLFSNIDDDNNDGFAAKLKVEQSIIKKDSLWNLNAFVDTQYIQENFRTIERLYNAEFIRDWNIEQTNTNQNVINNGNQILFTSGVQALHHDKGIARYQFEYLNYSENFNGSRHVLLGDLRLKKWQIHSNSSVLNAESNVNTSTFLRSYNSIIYSLKKGWVGTKLAMENNEQKDKVTDAFTALSQRFKSYEIFTGIGDSTKVFAEVGYKHRVNDSLVDTNLQKVNTSNTYYLDSRIIQNNNTNLSLYANYRTLNNEDESLDNEESLNSRIQFSQKLFKQIVHWNTIYETNSGSLAQQEFTYVEVEPGQGAYTWIDYNNNGIQELEEFEIAQFADQGTYIRVLLPNQVFVKTHQNRLSQTLTINPQQWSTEDNKSKKFWSHFYNQTSYLIDRKQKRQGSSFNLNPFKDDEDQQLGLQSNFRNVLFFNRGKQRYTTSYTFLTNSTKNLLSIGSIGSKSKSHQLLFNHKFATHWLINFLTSFNTNESLSENFTSKNFNLDETQFNPKLSYLFNDNARFDVFYQFTNKENTIDNFETLEQQKYGASFTFSSKQQMAISGEFNYFSNTFTGNANTPVAYQMLEGLQPGKNYTWTVLAQKKLTKYLDLNLNYFGRKTETSKTIHTGTIQLKAYF
ncbi:hypothetical protein ACFS5M_03785 [Lacinutrix iliipiscaria]|uniref:Uncharacterized protein n=1 Tax=Lacinutrix iliipiscaria TaxID=1230532 RepID=A0ABW5WNL6_9FLAO